VNKVYCRHQQVHQPSYGKENYCFHVTALQGCSYRYHCTRYKDSSSPEPGKTEEHIPAYFDDECGVQFLRRPEILAFERKTNGFADYGILFVFSEL